MAVLMTLGAIAFSERASAQYQQPQPQPNNLWTKFETPAPHATVAGLACGMDVKATVEGRYANVDIEAVEDGRQLCVGSQTGPSAVHARVKMTQDVARHPSEIIVEVEMPPGSSPQAANDLRGVLLNTAAELERRTKAPLPPPVVVAPPVVQTPPPPPVPMHPVLVTNTGVIAAGGAIFGGAYLVTLLVGSAIATAPGDPGTGRFWPFVPFFGAVAFSTTYKEATNCDCSAGRAFSVIGSIVIDAAQIAGVVIAIVGLVSPKTKMVPNSVSLHFGVHGGVLEGRF